MARMSIDEKIDQQKEVVLKIKEKYDAAVAELERLMHRDEARNKEILQAIAGSDKSYEEIMAFLTGGNKDE